MGKVKLLGKSGSGDYPIGNFAWTRNEIGYTYTESIQLDKYGFTTVADNTEQLPITVYYGTAYTFDGITGLFTITSSSTQEVPYDSTFAVGSNVYFTIGPQSNVMFKGSSASSESNRTKVVNNSNLVRVYGSSTWEYDYHSATPHPYLIPKDYITSNSEYTYPYDDFHIDGYYYTASRAIRLDKKGLRRNLNLKTTTKISGAAIEKATIPYYFEGGETVECEHQLYLAGSTDSTYKRYFYRIDGDFEFQDTISFLKLPNLPQDLNGNRLVTFRNEIHLIGGQH